jgi:dTDP-4-dehydrorhamnose 3,5-epimerase-like enzyme
MKDLFQLKTLNDIRGSLTVIEGWRDIPFEIKRVYYLHGINSDQSRGHHAHKQLRQLMIAASGEFDVLLDDGSSKTVHRLSRPDQGLLIDRMVWHEMYNFTPGAVCLVLASDYYDEKDYFRNYKDFIAALSHAN